MFAIETPKQRIYLAVAITFAIIPAITVGLRIYVRRSRLSHLTASDYCAMAALVLVLGICACGILNVVQGGTGMHQKDVPTPNFKIFLQSLFAIEIMWAVAGGLVKTSMCLFFMEIFYSRTFHYAAYVVIAFSVMFAIGSSLGSIFLCLPVESSLDPTVKGTCGNRNVAWVLQGSFNILTDLSVVMLPMPVVWRLQMPLIRKLSVAVVFSLGLFICVISGIRLQFLLQVNFYGDMSYTVTETMVWSLLEASIAVTGWMPSTDPYKPRRRTHDLWTSRLNHAHATRTNNGGVFDGTTFDGTNFDGTAFDGTLLKPYKAAVEVGHSITEPDPIHTDHKWHVSRIDA